uniref:Uncharacterized protein n=1 Tax=Setaria viridis TaxID=4556 RepID=A0A4U6T849_SETVI|nr:hypothetical protein SEVIR_9G492201v2 [Setaria viridis]
MEDREVRAGEKVGGRGRVEWGGGRREQGRFFPLSRADEIDFDNFVLEEKEFEDQKITEKGLSDAYQNVLERLAQLKKHGKVSKGADWRKRWKGGLELEPWMDPMDDGWKKDMLLEDVVDIDIGYDAPPPSFTAGMEEAKESPY